MPAVEIVPYNPAWPGEFEEIAAHLRAALGELALRVDHIGSTAVPGLDAKDIIDVQVTVARFDDALDAAFAAAGYIQYPAADHRPPGALGPDSDWQKRYFEPPPGARSAHIHVRVLGRPNQRYPLLFRDYLRAHPAAAGGYAAFKRVLAAYAGSERAVYFTIKDPVFDILIAAAEDWAQHTGWQGWQ